MPVLCDAPRNLPLSSEVAVSAPAADRTGGGGPELEEPGIGGGQDRCHGPTRRPTGGQQTGPADPA